MSADYKDNNIWLMKGDWVKMIKIVDTNEKIVKELKDER